jgi:hypothetical protein
MGPPELHVYGAYPRKADMDLTDHHTGASLSFQDSSQMDILFKTHLRWMCYHKDVM